MTQPSYAKGPDTPEIVNTALGDLLKEAATDVPTRTAMIFGHVEHSRQHWFLMDKFSLTESGKIQNFVLREQWLDGNLEEMHVRPSINQ